MRRHIPKDHLLAFARECLRLEKLLSEADDLADLAKFLKLVSSIERNGGIAALEALLRPEHTASAGPSRAWDSALASAATEAAPVLKDALAPLPASPTRPTHTKETP